MVVVPQAGDRTRTDAYVRGTAAKGSGCIRPARGGLPDDRCDRRCGCKSEVRLALAVEGRLAGRAEPASGALPQEDPPRRRPVRAEAEPQYPEGGPWGRGNQLRDGVRRQNALHEGRERGARPNTQAPEPAA